MAASRRYTWLWHPRAVSCACLDDTAGQAETFLAELCDEQPRFYSDPEVTGTAFGFVEIHLTVHAKDQWKLPWRIRTRLLPPLAMAMNLRPRDLELVGAVRPQPHHHPNRAARWRGKT